ncbi:translation initiation factor IF-1 [Orientia chuto str. Dubai]|uniref:Translation initiation factor IF-1 n=1 Tax=Orientia chuto str. Dubai TaxID=1359168 RepID=A0A0F3MHS8_9RICK|nr:translation initiation factor IF-1 [Candidatus Orientia mediorientalis]KJV55318.1 translation initiation factor IF-1 [Orientia chuto str. Dubai]
MAKTDTIVVTGEVIEVLPKEAKFKVKLSGSDHVITAYISGKIRMHHIKIIRGDKVDVEISPYYNPNMGRITHRHKIIKESK